MSFFRKSRQKGATLILLLTMIPLFLIPLVGLAIDGTMCYLVQAKLAGAVDGAALGAGRLLGTTANTNEIANEFLNVNFPIGWWNTNTLTPTITSSGTNGSSTINVYATVHVPLLFMRIFGLQFSTVAATATATRAFTRVELVLDRSGSMNNTDPISGLNVCTTMVGGAQNFVGMFTPGTDEVGLVVFGGSAVVGYPTTRPYNSSPTSSGGPDTSFATSSTAGPIFNSLGSLVCDSGTGMAEGLSLAYIELQKAHNRDFAANGADNRANNIVLFTDGVPTALAIQPNYVVNPITSSVTSIINNSSGCTYKAAQAATSTNKMTGWISIPGWSVSSPSNTSHAWGISSNGLTPQALMDLSAYDNTFTLTQWLGFSGMPTGSNKGLWDWIASTPIAAMSGCSHLFHDPTNQDLAINELTQVPAFDLYGNSTGSTDNGYLGSSSVYNGTAYTGTLSGSGTTADSVQLGMAFWNATDNIGKTIRSQTAMNPIKIMTIGYTGNGGTDAVLLKRLANEQDSTSYVATQQNGQFYQVDNANQLGPAFAAVAGAVLRLAK